MSNSPHLGLKLSSYCIWALKIVLRIGVLDLHGEFAAVETSWQMSSNSYLTQAESGLLAVENYFLLKLFFLVAVLTCIAFGPVILMTRQVLMMVFQITGPHDCQRVIWTTLQFCDSLR